MRSVGLAYAQVRFREQAREDQHGVRISEKESVKVDRDLEVVQIPEGFKVRLIRGTSVRVAQALGDSFTVTTEYGTMVRVSGKDADAIGEVVPSSTTGASAVP